MYDNTMHGFCKPVSQTTMIYPFKLNEFADDNFIFDENGKKFTKTGRKNTVGKGEIARNEQFLLFLQCFQKSCTADT